MSYKGTMTRRTFARNLFVGATGLPALARAGEAKPSGRYRGVSCMTFVWNTVLGPRGESVEDHFDEILAAIRSAGYEGVETFADMIDRPERAERMSDLLKKHGLRLSAVYKGGPLHIKPQGEETIGQLLHLARFMNKLGCDVLVFNPSPVGGREKTDAELQVQAELLNRLGRALRERSIALNIHSHTPAFRSNAREWRSNMDRTDPAVVWLNADVHWIYRGGCDPYKLLSRYADRIGSCHLRNSINGVWTETLGDGDIDYRRIAKIFARVRKPIWLTVELAYERSTKQTRSVAENIKLSRKYVREVFGA